VTRTIQPHFTGTPYRLCLSAYLTHPRCSLGVPQVHHRPFFRSKPTLLHLRCKIPTVSELGLRGSDVLVIVCVLLTTSCSLSLGVGAVYSTARCPHLPAEIWARIFTFGDAVSLWVNCRNVSRMLRAEAEREFATTRLPTLQIEWKFAGGQPFIDGGSVTSGELLGVSDNNAFATFSVAIDYPACKRPCMEDAVEASARQEKLTRTLRYSDLGLSYRISPGGMGAAFTTQQCSLDGVYNDVHIPSLTVDLDASTFTIEWRQFFDEFYHDSAYFQKYKIVSEASRPQGNVFPDSSADSVDRSLAAHLGDWSTCTASVEGGGKCPKSGSLLEQPLPWSQNFGEEDDSLYTEAYLHRLKRSLAHMEQDLDNENVLQCVNATDLWQWAEQHAVSQRRKRNALLFDDYKRRHGIHPCISDVGIFVPLFCGCNSSGSPRYSPISPHFSPLGTHYSTQGDFWNCEHVTPPRRRLSAELSPYSLISLDSSPTSPGFSPRSPGFSQALSRYSPTSPPYSPDSPWYSRNSPRSPEPPAFSPPSPTFSPASPQYPPTSPRYSPSTPTFGWNGAWPHWTPTSPTYSPTSPIGGYTDPAPTFQPPPPEEADSIMRDDTSYYDPPSDDENCGIDMIEE
jgi:hypothetical protein